jgi:branched-chain amino acid aminotransferase
MEVEVRPVTVEELADFDEVGACGTAAVISPICSINERDTEKVYQYCREGKAGDVSIKLYTILRDIQDGKLPDKFGWITVLE